MNCDTITQGASEDPAELRLEGSSKLSPAEAQGLCPITLAALCEHAAPRGASLLMMWQLPEMGLTVSCQQLTLEGSKSLESGRHHLGGIPCGAISF